MYPEISFDNKKSEKIFYAITEITGITIIAEINNKHVQNGFHCYWTQSWYLFMLFKTHFITKYDDKHS